MPRLLVSVAVVVVATAAGCGGGSGASSACGPDRREALDPSSASHVLGSGDDVEYLTDPPTSGPHAPGRPLSGVLDEPLGPAEQVGVLEAGGILLQHRDLAADDLAELSALAGDGVAVVPNADLPEPVVATAWLFKQTCDAVDADALRAFVEEHLGEGPGSDG